MRLALESRLETLQSSYEDLNKLYTSLRNAHLGLLQEYQKSKERSKCTQTKNKTLKKGLEAARLQSAASNAWQSFSGVCRSVRLDTWSRNNSFHRTGNTGFTRWPLDVDTTLDPFNRLEADARAEC